MALLAKAGHMERLMSVSWPLLIAASFQCGKDTTPIYGFTLNQKNIYGEKIRGAAGRVLGATDRPSVLYAHPGLSAYRAGLRKGDFILRINNSDISHKVLSPEELGELINRAGKEWAVERSEKDSDGEEKRSVSSMMEIEIERGGRNMVFTITGVPACRYPVLLEENDVVNAYADGEKVVVFSGLLRLLASDEELALVVAHEISHNTLGHNTKKKLNMVPGLIADLLLASVGINSHGTFTKATGNIYSKEFEAEADYSGLYILARAGMDISNAANLWRRMAAENPGSIYATYGSSHPSSPERFIAIESTAVEIKRKMAVGRALVPNRRDGKPESDFVENEPVTSSVVALPPKKVETIAPKVDAPAVVSPKEPTPVVAVKPEPPLNPKSNEGLVDKGKTEAPVNPAKSAPSVNIAQAQPVEPEPRKVCFIKGLVRLNVKTYYTPGDKYYYDKVLDKEKGDRMFCSEAEAKESGWSPAR
jgi:hypothetical protein